MAALILLAALLILAAVINYHPSSKPETPAIPETPEPQVLGDGEATYQMAEGNPGMNYLALEVYPPGVGALSFLKKGQSVNTAELEKQMQGCGYIRTPKVSVPGDFAIRGEVFDFYPFGSDEPVRAVFEFDEIDAVKTFDPITQASTGRLDSAVIPPCKEILWDSEHIETVRNMGLLKEPDLEKLVTENEVAEEEYIFPLTFEKCGHHEGTYTFQEYHSDGRSFKTFVPIMHGCNNFCSYCIVPYVRGREVSRSAEDILHEIEFLEQHNVREITLLGQNVNSYRGTYKGSEISFPELLDLICSHISSIGWVRFLSSHPKDFSSKLIDTIAANPQVCRHIHLPVQHGSNRILELMNRRYTKEHADQEH